MYTVRLVSGLQHNNSKFYRLYTIYYYHIILAIFPDVQQILQHIYFIHRSFYLLILYLILPLPSSLFSLVITGLFAISVRLLILCYIHQCFITYQMSHKGSLRILEWVAYSFSSGSSQPRNQIRVSCIAGGFFTSSAISSCIFVNQ